MTPTPTQTSNDEQVVQPTVVPGEQILEENPRSKAVHTVVILETIEPPNQTNKYDPNTIEGRYHIRQTIVDKNQPVHPIFVFLLDLFVISGSGHLLMGQRQKGTAFLLIELASLFFILMLMVVAIGFFLIPVLLIYRLIIAFDGYEIAKRIQEKRTVMQGECSNRIATLGVEPFVCGPLFIRKRSELENCKLQEVAVSAQ